MQLREFTTAILSAMPGRVNRKRRQSVLPPRRFPASDKALIYDFKQVSIFIGTLLTLQLPLIAGVGEGLYGPLKRIGTAGKTA